MHCSERVCECWLSTKNVPLSGLRIRVTPKKKKALLPPSVQQLGVLPNLLQDGVRVRVCFWLFNMAAALSHNVPPNPGTFPLATTNRSACSKGKQNYIHDGGVGNLGVLRATQLTELKDREFLVEV